MRNKKVFPRDFKFQSIEEINDYYSGDNIQCLLCGRFYKSLSNHIRAKHSMTPDGYKEKYGLPWVRGLTCKKEHNRASKASKKRFNEGYEIPKTAETYKIAREKKSRGGQPFRNKQIKEFLKKRKEKWWDDESFERLIVRVKDQKRLPYDIADNDADMPCRSAIDKKRKRDINWKERLNSAVDLLPIEILVKAQITPNRIINVVKLLKKQNCTNKEIAIIIRTSTLVVHRILTGKNTGRKHKYA